VVSEERDPGVGPRVRLAERAGERVTVEPESVAVDVVERREVVGGVPGDARGEPAVVLDVLHDEQVVGRVQYGGHREVAVGEVVEHRRLHGQRRLPRLGYDRPAVVEVDAVDGADLSALEFGRVADRAAERVGRPDGGRRYRGHGRPSGGASGSRCGP
jgi:hypothetical protein